MAADDIPAIYIPLRELLPPQIEEFDVLASIPGLGTALDSTYYSDAWGDWRDSAFEFVTTLWIFQGVGLGVPWLPGLEFRLGGDAANPARIDVAGVAGIGWNLAVDGIPFRLRLPPEMLRPVDESLPFAEVEVMANVTVDQDLNIDFSAADSINLPESFVAGTTFAIGLKGLSFNLGGGDPTARGIAVEEAILRLPPELAFGTPLDIRIEDLAINGSGVSGSAIWQAPADGVNAPTWNASAGRFTGIGTGDLFGALPFSLRTLEFEVVDNVPSRGRIVVHAFVPFFDKVVAVEANVDASGGLVFALASAAEPQPEGTAISAAGLVSLKKDGVLAMDLTRLELALVDGIGRITLSGSLTPDFGGLAWPTFQVDGLGIDSTGKVTIDGGWIDVGTQGVVDLGGAMLEIAKVGFGREDDGTRWVGFSGGLKLSDPLPVSGAVEGLKINWKGNDLWLSLQGAAVGFEIPDTVRFNGHVSLLEDPVEPRTPGAVKKRGFRGGGSLVVIPTNLAVNAEVIVGKSEGTPAYPFAYLFVDVQTPVGIPLPIPNLAIYGFSGLLGLSMEPKKDPGQKWWEDWYLVPVSGISSSEKWRPARGAFAFGAGVTLGTAADNGYAVHARLLLALLIPGPTILLEGVAGFLEDRSKLGDDSPVRALALWDGAAGQLLVNAQARYPFQEGDAKERLIKASGGSEALFTARGDWHFYLGERSPRDRRIRAELFRLFEARSYLMLGPDEVGFGFWVGYDKKWKKGPLRVDLEAWMDANARVSWRPVQFRGDLALVGSIGLKAYGVGASLGVNAEVTAQGPTPYRVHAEVDVKLKTPKLVPDPKFHFEWDYEQQGVPAIVNPIGRLGVEHLKVTETWPLDDASSEESAPLVPMDAKLSIAFERSVEDAAQIGTNGSGIPPWERVGDYEFTYRLTEIRIERRAKSATSYEPFLARTSTAPDEGSDGLWGAWLAVEPTAAAGEPAADAPMTKLLLHAKSPFEYARAAADNSNWDHFTEWFPDFGAVRVHPVAWRCFAFDGLATDTPFEVITRDGVIIKDDPFGDLKNPFGSLFVRGARPPVLDFGGHADGAWLFFPEPIRQVMFMIRTQNQPIVIKRYNGSLPVLPNAEVADTSFVFKTIGGLRGSTFNVVRLEGRGELVGACYITAADVDRFNDEKNAANTTVAGDDHWDDPPGTELFLSESYYRFTVVAEGRRRRRGESEIETVSFPPREAYFQTGGPPGVFYPPGSGAMTPDDGNPRYPSQGPLKDLTPYVLANDRNEAATNPTHGALAVYRTYDVGIELNDPIAESMYVVAGMPLALSVYDPNGIRGQSLALGPTAPPPSATSWGVATTAQGPVAAQTQYHVSGELAVQYAQVAPGPNGAINPFVGGFVVPQPSDLADLPDWPALWCGGSAFLLQPNTQYRAVVESIRPAAIIPLDDTGLPRQKDGKPVVDLVFNDGSNLDIQLSETTASVVTDGTNVVAYAPPGLAVAAQPNLASAQMSLALQAAVDAIGVPAKAVPVYTWNFTTSRFATFVHHIQSFVDRAWDRKTMPGLAWVDLDDNARAELRGAIQGGDSDEGLFQRARTLFKVGDDPLPQRMEVELLADAGGRYGFLITSPEPIDWRRQTPDGDLGRVTLEIRRSATVANATTASLSPLKVVGANIVAGDQWIELLARDSVEVGGWTIETMDAGAAAPTVFHQFAAGARLTPGAVLRICSAAPPAPPAQAEYAVQQASAGAALDPGGITAILKEASGEEMHRRQAIPRGSFNEQFIERIASNADGTRSFVFLVDAGAWNANLAAGSYQFTFTYRRRDAGADRLILRRNTSTEAETSAIVLALAAQDA